MQFDESCPMKGIIRDAHTPLEGVDVILDHGEGDKLILVARSGDLCWMLRWSFEPRWRGGEMIPPRHEDHSGSNTQHERLNDADRL